MSAKAFVDTNILVYAALADSAHSTKRADAVTVLTSDIPIAVSTQILNEFYVVLLKHGFADQEIRKRVDEVIAGTEVNVITVETIRHAWKMREQYRLSFWDSLVVASALESRCSVLYTEDMQHGQVISKRLKIVNPFR